MKVREQITYGWVSVPFPKTKCCIRSENFLGGERGVFEGIRKSDVVRDYLERIGEELESEEELIEKKGLIEKVIDRLLYQVRWTFHVHDMNYAVPIFYLEEEPSAR